MIADVAQMYFEESQQQTNILEKIFQITPEAIILQYDNLIECKMTS